MPEVGRRGIFQRAKAHPPVWSKNKSVLSSMSHHTIPVRWRSISKNVVCLGTPPVEQVQSHNYLSSLSTMAIFDATWANSHS